MQVILKANGAVMHILGRAKPANGGWRLMQYCVEHRTKQGVLLFHVLTRELLLLDAQEYENRLELAYLKDHWFVVPQETADMELARLARWALGSMRKAPKQTANYTILTTTDCNARCFYCYEKGCTKITMSDKTACDTAAYIRENCGGKRVRLSWFGGEPLLNTAAIDRICAMLREAGIEYTSMMTSNAYLFDEENIRKALESWRLKSVQITLDGTQDVYNRSKAYVACEGSAYQVVMGNIARLLEAGIHVSIRLNLGLHNAQDLRQLAGELAKRFAGKAGVSVYVRLLYDLVVTPDPRQEQLYAALFELEDTLAAHGLFKPDGREVARELRLAYCMADSGSSAVVAPDGRLGLCEHYPECGFFGHVCSPERDETVIAAWREMQEEQAECAGCFYYPTCMRQKRCTALGACTQYSRMDTLRSVRRSMEFAYRRYLAKTEEAAGKEEAKMHSC